MTTPPTPERIAPRTSTLGEGLQIRRALPSRQQRLVGAWCFLDHIGPTTFTPEDAGMHVGAHPHIGLQTFTWMIEGHIRHGDSLGNALVIAPGQVNLMTAGHGISHTEDSLPEGGRMHAAQLWIALPPDKADTPPAFEHHTQLPIWTEDGCTFTLLAGQYGTHTSPCKLYTPLVGLEIVASTDSTLTLPLDTSFEYGCMLLEGSATWAGLTLAEDELGYLPAGASTATLQLGAGTRVLLLGGTPFETSPTIWWNFVSFDRNAITQARADWEQAHPRFGTVEGGEHRRLGSPELPWR